MMMTARWLLDHDPDPDEATIREAISGQLCRCTGYENIVRVGPLGRRARQRRGGRARRGRGAGGEGMTTVAPDPVPTSEAGNPIGFGRMLRKEDVRFLRGRAATSTT